MDEARAFWAERGAGGSAETVVNWVLMPSSGGISSRIAAETCVNVSTCKKNMSTCRKDTSTSRKDRSTCRRNTSTCGANMSTCRKNTSRCRKNTPTCRKNAFTCRKDMSACRKSTSTYRNDTSTKETSHTDGAQAWVEEIRTMRQRIPNFVIPESKKATSGYPLPPRFPRSSSSWRRWP